MKDSALWDGLKSGNREALKGIYDKYFDALFTYGLKLSGDSEGTEDAIHELFVDLWKYREGLSATTSIEFYLYRSLRRKIYKSAKMRARATEIDQQELAIDLAQESIESALIENESTSQLKSILEQSLQKLPPRQQESLMLRFYGELSYRDIAGVLNINEQSARNLIQRGLECLRKGIKPLL